MQDPKAAASSTIMLRQGLLSRRMATQSSLVEMRDLKTIEPVKEL